jgi:diketogulonate reductase-like aldo/keto reductase
MDEYRFVTSSCGVRLPRIIYGTAWKTSQTEALVSTAIRSGFCGIDTAGQPRHYDEAGVGAGIDACLNDGLGRADLYVQTKFTPVSGHDPQRIPYDPRAPIGEQVAQSFRSSLANLRTDYVDCLILHSPLDDGRRTMDAWRAMEAIVAAGGARQLGISNCYSPGTLERLYNTATVRPAVVQNRFYAETRYDREIRAYCRRQGIIYQSFWTLTANPHILDHELIRRTAAKYGRTPAQILFRWLTQDGVVPLTGTKSDAHMREDLAIFDFALTGEERAAVAALFL